MKELSKKYEHKLVEENKYDFWLKGGYFKSGDKTKTPFTIVIPPPNVTGKLHLGHAWDNTLQDMIIRRKRMQGFDALYLPGMDHAGIATQAKVDATRGYGAEVILHGGIFDEAKEKSESISKVTNQTFMHPYDDRHVIAGQGTIALEILEDMYNVDVIIAPIGGGGLISGVALGAKTINPRIKVIGVQAENVHGMAESTNKGEISSHFRCATLADGCAVKTPGSITFEIFRLQI